MLTFQKQWITTFYNICREGLNCPFALYSAKEEQIVLSFVWTFAKIRLLGVPDEHSHKMLYLGKVIFFWVLLDFLLQLLQIQCSVRAISNSKMMDGMMAFGRWYETLPRVRVYKYDYAGMCVLCIFHPYFCNLRTAYPVQSLTIKSNRSTTLVFGKQLA